MADQAAANPDRATVLAEMAALPAATENVSGASAEADTAVEAKADAPDLSADTTAAPAEVDADEADAKPAEAVDPETSKRLEVVNRHEKRLREQLAKDAQAARAEVEAERKKLEPVLEQVKRFEALKARAAYEPDKVLAELGVTPDHYEAISRVLWNLRPGAGDDPKTREAAQRLMREREQGDRLSQYEQKLAEMEAKITRQSQQAEFEQHRAKYLDAAIKSAGDATPLFAKLAAANPTKARNVAWATAERLLDETGEMPDPEDVIQAFEKARRAEIEELGFDVAALAPKKAATPAPARPGKSLTTGASATPAERSAHKTDRELRDSVLRELASLPGD